MFNCEYEIMHLSSALGTLIKPLALKFSDQHYHLFYLFSPTNRENEKSVGHAVSQDLVNWRHKSVLLLNASQYTPIGFYVDGGNNSSLFDSLSNDNFVILFRDEKKAIQARYWNKHEDVWLTCDYQTVSLVLPLNENVIGLGNEIESGTYVELIYTDALYLFLTHSDFTKPIQTKVLGVSRAQLKTVRLDLGMNASDGKLTVLLTLLIQDSDEKIYIKYVLVDGVLREENRIHECGTKKRMLSLINNRLIEFSTSDGAYDLMHLPAEVHFAGDSLSRSDPLELLNCFSGIKRLESGVFLPISRTYKIILNCTILNVGQKVSLALFSNQAPLITIVKGTDGMLNTAFGYGDCIKQFMSSSQVIDVIVDGGIVEVRNDQYPVLMHDFGEVNSFSPGVAIFPEGLDVTMAILSPSNL